MMEPILATDVSAKCRSCGLTDSINLPAESVRAFMQGTMMVHPYY